jgi:branched-chain amino acid transport system permease protein
MEAAMGVIRHRGLAAVLVGAFCLFWVPMFGFPAYYETFLYLIFFWIAIASSWTILGGYAGYFSFGAGAFFGVGAYTTATLTTWYGVPFLWTMPVGAILAGLIAVAIGAVVFRLNTLRGELFALITLAITFILATIVSNTPLDGGSGVYLLSVKVPHLMPSTNGTMYVIALLLAAGAVTIAYAIQYSRFGMGLFAIHDDEDAAEVKGIPTFRYKLIAFAISSAIAGAVGSLSALYVGYLAVPDTFSLTLPLYAILMCVLGGRRHWLGPAVGATLITVALNLSTSGADPVAGKAAVAAAMVLVVLLVPNGIVAVPRGKKRGLSEAAVPASAVVPPPTTASTDGKVLLVCREVEKSFGGIRALHAVTLDVREGEILGLVGPNGSGKSTLINVVSGHFRAGGGTIEFDGAPLRDLPAHAIARRGIARTYQIPRPFERLSVLDNVALCASFGAGAGVAAGRNEAAHWLNFTGLAGKAEALPSELNLHERKFLEFARALATRPRLLLLDEVLSGLNSGEIEGAIALIRRIRAGGTTIVFVEHVMRAVIALSDRIAVLDHGVVIALGEPQATMRDPKVVGVYLGKASAA